MPAPKQSKAGRPILTLPRKRRGKVEVDLAVLRDLKTGEQTNRDEFVEVTDDQLRYLDGQSQ